jgi:8-oxo-dGTP pyrophosphatase MutT (NUDIX family)
MAGSRQETCAGGVVFCRGPAETQYVLIHDGHGNWGFPKGHLEGKESPVEAATREVREEIGVDDVADHGAVAEIDWAFWDRRVRVHKRCLYFLFEATTMAVRPQVEEGIRACAWLTFDEAKRRLTFENTRAVLEEADRLVTQLRQAGSADRG